MMTTEILLPGIGEPESLQVRVRDLGQPGPGEALVRVEATGISFAEQQMRRGRYYNQPAFPFVPGYDLVGVVEALGVDAPPDGPQVGERVAALTKIGGWAERVLLDAADLVPVPAGVDAAAAETAIVNGSTAWRMLHRSARVRPGDTVVVLGAGGGVGTILVQLARVMGLDVIGVAGAPQLDRVRALGATPVDHRREDVPARVRELAPGGVAAVFDHVAGPGLSDSWRMLAPGGTLVVYGTLAVARSDRDPRLPFVLTIARVLAWNLLPNGRHASFFNVWAGHTRHLDRFRTELRADLGQVFAHLADGTVTAQVAAEYPLEEAAAALRRAESGGLTGKVLLRPTPHTGPLAAGG
jgi:NADPH:quinone reductase-like Zn-dependent oxidoreductase